MPTPQKIVLIRSSFTPFGGVERVALSLIKDLVAMDLDVTLLTWPDQAWPVAAPNLNIVPVGINRGHRFIRAWTFNRAVCRYVASQSFDRVFSLDMVSCYTHLHAGGGTHKRFLRIKNADSPPMARFFRRLSLFHNYLLKIEQQGYQNPVLKKIRCNSSMVKADILNDYPVDPRKLAVIPSGIDWQGMEEVFAQKDKVKASLCQAHGLAPEREYLLFLGSDFGRKGLDIAIQGLGSVSCSYDLIVVGKGSPGPFKKMIHEAGLAGRVHFLGPQPKGWRFGALCKGLVLPSRYDPFGGAAAEGHAMGLPVLVSETTGYAEHVQPQTDGVIIKSPMTPANVIRAFQEFLALLEDPPLPDRAIRDQARQMDNAVIRKQVIEGFLELS